MMLRRAFHFSSLSSFPFLLLVLLGLCPLSAIMGVAADTLAADSQLAPEPPFVTLTVEDSSAVPPWVANAGQCRLVSVPGVKCLEIEADQDPYTKVEWRLRMPNLARHAGETAVLEIEFFDQGAGVIEPRLLKDARFSDAWLRPSRRGSYTRLNTLTNRRAWFEFQLPGPQSPGADAGEVRLTGLQYLRAIRWLPKQSDAAWSTVKAAVPKNVQPMVTLQRPMELVTTAGVDVLGDMSALPASLEALNELAPLARVLGFTSIESYVTWKRLEPRREGEFDFTFYDAVVKKLAEYQLKWFPLLVVGSGYALPDWFMGSKENVGFVCLEHGLSNAIQSIWSPYHRRHVTRVLRAFGQHYEPLGALEGVRLGPSGNYGESQYPAGGNWGPGGAAMHIHIGWWAADPYAQADLRRWVKHKHGSLGALNRAWETRFASFEEIKNLSVNKV